MKATYIESIPVKNALGECILSQPKTNNIWWTDILSCQLFRYDLEHKKLTQWSTPERLCAFGFVETQNIEQGFEQGTQLIAAFESGFALYQPETAQVNWLAKPEQQLKGNRLNDGRVDRQGRFWSGAMVENADDNLNSPSTTKQSGLYRLDGSNVTQMEDDISISNSLCWSLDSKKMYFADSTKKKIYVYDFDAASGNISNKRLFAQTTGDIAPDGSIIDSQGYLWNAQWGGSQVVRYTPDGDIDFVIPLPVSQPTCLAFGGLDMKTLFITSASEYMPKDKLKSEPQAGNVLIYQTDFIGVEESQYLP